MAVPKYHEMYNEFLSALIDLTPHSLQNIRLSIAAAKHLSKEDLEERLSSGAKLAFNDRVNWTGTYLKKAGLVSTPSRGVYLITEEGFRVISTTTVPLTDDFLMQYPSFQEFRERSVVAVAAEQISNDNTPLEIISAAYSTIHNTLADDLMGEILKRDSVFFERLVVKLLLKMGYGGSISNAGIVTKPTNDGGIDGIIKEDKLGFDQIYIQAKRWDPEKTISRPEIQKFSGALQDEHASKGLFITTAKFSDGARESANKQHIVLVDGEALTKLMIEFGLGVSTIQTYEIKTLDSDFFEEDC